MSKGPASKRSTEYEVANGERIPNFGEKKFLGVATEGVSRWVVAHVCDIHRPLLSVMKIMSPSNKVIFAPSVSYIETKTTREDVDERG